MSDSGSSVIFSRYVTVPDRAWVLGDLSQPASDSIARAATSSAYRFMEPPELGVRPAFHEPVESVIEIQAVGEHLGRSPIRPGGIPPKNRP